MWHHDSYVHHVYHHAASAEGHWLGHTIVSSLIHGLIYGAIFHLMRGVGAGEVLLVAALGVLVFGGGWWLWSRR
jgi:homoaconitase/3-isopropylmalate dehydratase large subunit